MTELEAELLAALKFCLQRDAWDKETRKKMTDLVARAEGSESNRERKDAT